MTSHEKEASRFRDPITIHFKDPTTKQTHSFQRNISELNTNISVWKRGGFCILQKKAWSVINFLLAGADIANVF